MVRTSLPTIFDISALLPTPMWPRMMCLENERDSHLRVLRSAQTNLKSINRVDRTSSSFYAYFELRPLLSFIAVKVHHQADTLVVIAGLRLGARHTALPAL